MAESEDYSLRRFWQPWFWPTWLLWFAMQLVAKLPPRARMRVGRRLGKLLGRIKMRERRIARRNLEVCFPELSGA